MSPEEEYNQAADNVGSLLDKPNGMNANMAWREVDPTGVLRKVEEERQRHIQDEINHIGAQAAEQVAINQDLARIQAIPDPDKRASELLLYKARQVAKRDIKARGY